MATCNKPVGSGVMSFLCDLESSHPGPCRAQGNDRSLRVRAAWEQEQAQAKKTLSETQGPARTSAEAWGDGNATGTPPPDYFRCAYHQNIHHKDQRSPKCMAWSGDWQGPMPTHILRIQETMGSPTVVGELPDMPDDNVRPPMIYEQQGDKLVQSQPAVHPDPATDFEEKRPPAYPEVDPESEEQNGPATDRRVEDRRYAPSQDQMEKVKDREGDQPMPIPNDRKTAHEHLIEIVQGRLHLGIQRYGVGLQPFNGRDSQLDALEELVDLAVYLITFREERAELIELLGELQPMVGMSIRGNQIIDRIESFLRGHSA